MNYKKIAILLQILVLILYCTQSLYVIAQEDGGPGMESGKTRTGFSVHYSRPSHPYNNISFDIRCKRNEEKGYRETDWFFAQISP